MLVFNLAVANNTQLTAKYFSSISADPNQLLLFLQQMPKGGILHSHLSGAVFAEDLVSLGAAENYCLNPNTQTAYLNPNCQPKLQFKSILHESNNYNSVLDAWSLRDFDFNAHTGEQHFFAVFGKFGAVTEENRGQILADVVRQAYQQKIIYLELMTNPDNFSAAAYAKKLIFSEDFARMQQELLRRGIKQLADKTSAEYQQMLAKKNQLLRCDSEKPDPACFIKVDFIYQIMRNQEPSAFFAQSLEAFMVAQQNPNVVGVTMVQDEAGLLSLTNYTLEMQIIGYLHHEFPSVHINLHAGELNPNEVTPADLSNHIQQAINIAGSQRIGHGVDIAYENDAEQLLKEMALKKILVEINLSSNAEILGIKGKQHPLPLYLKYGVPVALSTDDGGVLRTDISREFQRAVLTYHLSYPTIKQFVRNSLTYSFMPGMSLWQNAQAAKPVIPCAKDELGSSSPSQACQHFLAANVKAKMQWRLESEFNHFEAMIASQHDGV